MNLPLGGITRNDKVSESKGVNFGVKSESWTFTELCITSLTLAMCYQLETNACCISIPDECAMGSEISPLILYAPMYSVDLIYLKRCIYGVEECD